MILSASRLTKAMAKAYDTLRIISGLLLPRNDPEHDETANEFINAVNAYDHDKANLLIIKSVRAYLNESNVSYGLSEFCNKFDIDADLSTMTYIQAIKFITSHYDEMNNKLRQYGL